MLAPTSAIAFDCYDQLGVSRSHTVSAKRVFPPKYVELNLVRVLGLMQLARLQSTYILSLEAGSVLFGG